jgi:hypothetical protein
MPYRSLEKRAERERESERKVKERNQPDLLALEFVFHLIHQCLDGWLIVSNVKNDFDLHCDLAMILKSDLTMIFELLPTTWRS